jgi:type VI secretion system protein ImpE
MPDARVDAESALRAGDPRAALQHLTSAVRARPADAKLRIFMAQLLCVLGQWERAHTQLNVVADMDSETVAMRETVGHAIRCELMRAKVFAGNRTPMVFGQPDEWLALLIESLLQKGQGNTAMADDLAARAFDAAPEMKGRIDAEAFAWIADADSRLGPVLEASTAATTGCRSRAFRTLRSTRHRIFAIASGCRPLSSFRTAVKPWRSCRLATPARS